MAARLLDRLCELNPSAPREKLLALVLAGDVQIDGRTERDPKASVSDAASCTISEGRRYVSRGGQKLAHAIATWQLPVEGLTFADAGASTGGFTDCLLKHGANFVHSIDVGYNQIDYSLRTDERVNVLERTNIMAVPSLSPAPNAAVADLSFRSLAGAAAHLLSLTTDRWGVLLIKPQFEWTDAPASFDGIVPADAVPEIIRGTLRSLVAEGLSLSGLVRSPITGRKGNVEYLLLVGRGEALSPERLAAAAE